MGKLFIKTEGKTTILEQCPDKRIDEESIQVSSDEN